MKFLTAILEWIWNGAFCLKASSLRHRKQKELKKEKEGRKRTADSSCRLYWTETTKNQSFARSPALPRPFIEKVSVCSLRHKSLIKHMSMRDSRKNISIQEVEFSQGFTSFRVLLAKPLPTCPEKSASCRHLKKWPQKEKREQALADRSPPAERAQPHEAACHPQNTTARSSTSPHDRFIS